MKIIIIVVILYLLFKPNYNFNNKRRGNKEVPPASYNPPLKVPKQPRGK